MPKDLFGATPNDACSAYCATRAATDGAGLRAREHCEDLWRDYELLADRNFLIEFPRHFHERWFEMYLTVALLRAGLDVMCRKPGPDICLTVEGRKIWIEATCASSGEPGRPDSVPEFPWGAPVATRVPKEQIALRIRNSVEVKQKAFCRYLFDGIVGPGDGLVIAINTDAVWGAPIDVDKAMFRALYGVGDLMVAIDPSTGTEVERRRQQLVSIPKRSTGEPVGVRPFADGSLPHIAAVIGSNDHVGNVPKRLGDGLTLFPNMTAKTLWPEGTVKLGTEWSFTQSPDGWEARRVSFVP